MNFATMVFVEGEPGANCYCIDEDLLLPEHDDQHRARPQPGRAEDQGVPHQAVRGRCGRIGAQRRLSQGRQGRQRRVPRHARRRGHDPRQRLHVPEPRRRRRHAARSTCSASPRATPTPLPLAHSFVRASLNPTRASPLTRHRFAAAQVETFSVQQMAHALPPPPVAARAAPAAAAKRVPPLFRPCRPRPPPDGIIGLRTWSPATYNSAPEGPRRRLQRPLLPVLRLRSRVRRQRRHRHHRLPRALPQVGLAALHPDHGAQHDRPGHLPLECVPLRVQ